MKEETNPKITYAELCYLCFFGIMLFAKGMGLVDHQWPYELTLLVGGVLFLAKLLLTENTPLEWSFLIALTVLGIAIYLHSGERGALINIATVLGLKGVDKKRVFRLGAVIWSATMVIQIMLCLFHLRPDFFKVQEKLALGYIVRWSLGAPHPNVLQISAMILCAFLLYLGNFHGKRLYKVTALMLLFNLYIFLYSVSFTGIALAVLYLCGNVYFTERKRFTGAERGIFYAVFPVSLLFAILGPLYLPEPLWSIFNKLLNTRFFIARTFMSMNPVTLFGVGWCNELPADLNNLDSSYVYALMHYGILFFLVFAAGYLFLVHRLIRKTSDRPETAGSLHGTLQASESRKELAIVLCFAVAAISEPFFVNSSFKNISLIFLGEALYEAVGKGRALSLGFLTEFGKRTVEVPADRIGAGLRNYADVLIRNRKKLLCVSLGAAILGIVCFVLFYRSPSAYYVRLYDVQDYLWERVVYLDPDALPADFTGEILSSGVDAETPLMTIDGNAVRLEYARGLISSGLWAAFWATFAVSVIYFCGDRKGRKHDVRGA